MGAKILAEKIFKTSKQAYAYAVKKNKVAKNIYWKVAKTKEGWKATKHKVPKKDINRYF